MDLIISQYQAHIWNHAFSYINSMSLKCAIQLGIPDIIHNHGRAMTLSDLVNALPIDDKSKGLDCVYRLMRILTHAGFFIKTNKDTNELDRENIIYVLTSTSCLLLKDEPLSVIPYLQAQFDPILMGHGIISANGSKMANLVLYSRLPMANPSLNI
ncbi:hypothetical protein P3L10_009208 [Capsicum annuum]